jgi:hypothetical protein
MHYNKLESQLQIIFKKDRRGLLLKFKDQIQLLQKETPWQMFTFKYTIIAPDNFLLFGHSFPPNNLLIFLPNLSSFLSYNFFYPTVTVDRIGQIMKLLPATTKMVSFSSFFSTWMSQINLPEGIIGIIIFSKNTQNDPCPSLFHSLLQKGHGKILN